MGAFAEAFPAFAAHNIPIIPTYLEAPAQPMVKRPDKFGISACRKLLDIPRYANANAAIYTGRRARLTVVDVDSTDPAHEQEARRIFGDTPVTARTPSGGAHLYYRHNGEGRRIRLFGSDLPLDVLGSGLAVCPPSVRSATAEKRAGRYSFAEGSTADFGKLPMILPGAIPDSKAAFAAKAPTGSEPGTMKDGDGRNASLFRTARILAAECATLADTEARTLEANSAFAQPLPVPEALRVARSAWDLKQSGKLILPGSQSAIVALNELNGVCYLPALALLIHLRCHHGPAHVFAVVPEGLAKVMGISSRTIWKAREYLVRAGYLTLIRKGGLVGGDQVASLYRLRA